MKKGDSGQEEGKKKKKYVPKYSEDEPTSQPSYSDVQRTQTYSRPPQENQTRSFNRPKEEQTEANYKTKTIQQEKR